MAEALVSAVLTQLTTTVSGDAGKEIRLVLGVKEDVRKLKSKFEAVQKVLADAENKLEDPNVRRWLDGFKKLAYDMEDVLDEWNTLILKRQSITRKSKVCSFFTSPCVCFGKLSLRHDVAHKIKTIKENLNDIVEDQQLYKFSETANVVDATISLQERSTTSFIDVSEIEGRDEEKNTLVNKLLSGSSEGGKDLHAISLVGLGGIGKTTLAKLAYNHDEIVNGFEERVWVCVSEPVDRIRIAITIIQEMTKDHAPGSTKLESLLQEIIQELKKGHASSLTGLDLLLKEIVECIKGKRFLLVLDDVWTENRSDLEDLFLCLKNGLAGSKVLVTTRNERVASVFESDIIYLKELSEGQCWSIFSRLAFPQGSTCDREKFEEIGRKIVTKCKGLPLTAKALGSLLRFKENIVEWESILESEIWTLDFVEGPLPSLSLSYNHLPYMVKRCFSYCAVFPKDYEIGKEDLIQLWMAQGYLASEHNQELEITGNEYFNILASRSFFQEFKRDALGNIVSCKMHDIVHDLAQYLTQNECLTTEVNGDEDPRVQNARHAMIVLGNNASLPIAYRKSKTLRSLLVEHGDYCNILVREIFNQLKCLRALKFVNRSIFSKFTRSDVDISKEIQNLKQLKYFNVSQNFALKELPEELCELYNLQTLNVSSCHSLEKLPRGIEKLINLRHLINSSTCLRYMPKGIKELTHLRTLNEFVVSDSNHAEEASSLEGLKHLKHLQGSLWIRRLGNVRDVSEAKGAELHNKTKLHVLHLDFGARFREDSASIAEDDEQRLEALQPLPPNLQRLFIVYYRGKYISQIWLTPLTHLRFLWISNCENLEYLPPLGKLSSLESLHFSIARRMKKVSTEFLGIESGISTSLSPASSITLFPKLTCLEFDSVWEWEEWDYGIIGKDENIQIMPSLVSLTIDGCHKLKALPDHLFLNASLKKLKIENCRLLYSYLKERGQQWPLNFHIPKISYEGYWDDSWHVYKIVIDPKEHKFELECLDPYTKFVVRDSNHAEEASSLEGLKHLEHLQGTFVIRGLGNVRDVSEVKEAELYNKTKLTVLELHFEASDEEESTRTAEDDELLLEALQPLPHNLQRLDIDHYRGKYISQIFQTPLIQLRELHIDCDNLEYLPPLGKLPSLDSLVFENAHRLKNVSTEFLGVESGILTSTSSASPITVFPKLTYLWFQDMPEWEEWDYGIIGKDENIQIMPSLVSLEIHDCPKLKALPDHLFLKASLKELDISDCPLLYSYLKKRGQQWPLNFHIPEITYSGMNEDDSDYKRYKSVIDPKEHKFDFRLE